MNLQDCKKRISDLSKEEQTDEMLSKLYDLTFKYVKFYQPKLYSQYKGEVEDLAHDFYESFILQNGRRGRTETLLDKYDPKKSSLDSLVKTAVQRKLIDKMRLDKGEVNFSTEYDEETGNITIDYIGEEPFEEEDVSVDDMTFDDDALFLTAIHHIDKMKDWQYKEFIEYFEEVKNVIAPNVRKFVEELLNYKEN